MRHRHAAPGIAAAEPSVGLWGGAECAKPFPGTCPPARRGEHGEWYWGASPHHLQPRCPGELPAFPLPALHPPPRQEPPGKMWITVWREKPALSFPLPQPGAQLGRVSSNN